MFVFRGAPYLHTMASFSLRPHVLLRTPVGTVAPLLNHQTHLHMAEIQDVAVLVLGQLPNSSKSKFSTPIQTT
jgi:hypothetical protein